MSYLPCELHCHTVHSDGDFQVRELLENARSEKLSLIALTDHNTLSGHDELDDSVLPAIRGIEWTTYYGHMLVLGARKFIDWRDAVPTNIDEKIHAVKAAGGVVGIAHPFQIGSPVCTGGRWEFEVKNWDNVDYMEIWHEDLTTVSSENKKAFELWTSLLDKGHKIAATYGRDWHRTEKSGRFGCTYLNMEGKINQDNALCALKHGRTVVSTGVKFFFRLHRLGNTFSIGDTVRKGTYVFSFFTDIHSAISGGENEDISYRTIKIVTNSSKTVLETRYDQRHVRLTLESQHWYRAELWGDADGTGRLLAVTSPVYCQ